jgi:hypothetical protein
MPLNQPIESRHGERQTGMAIRLDPIHDLLEVRDECQHRQHGLDEHTVLPRATLTQCEMAGIALAGMKGRVAQDNHALFALANQPLKGVLRDMGGGALPCDDQGILDQRAHLHRNIRFYVTLCQTIRCRSVGKRASVIDLILTVLCNDQKTRSINQKIG